MSLIRDLVERFRFTVIMELMGLQFEDRAQYMQWFNSFVCFALVISHSPTTLEARSVDIIAYAGCD